MSYRLNIVVKNGVASIGEFGGEIPEGNWTIGGHEDEYGSAIHVVRRLPNGRHVSEAQHYQAHKNYDDSKFEPVEPEPVQEAAPEPTWHTPLATRASVGPATPSDGIPKHVVVAHDPSIRFANGPVEVQPGLWRNSADGPGWLSQKVANKERARDLASAAREAPRPPYSEDIPLPDGEHYPDNTCGYCLRTSGSSDAPCEHCPDVSSIPSPDSLADEPPVGYTRPGEDGQYEDEDVSPAVWRKDT